MSDPLESKLPLKPGENGILIKWDRASGDFVVFFDGPDLHIASAIAIFDAVKKATQAKIDAQGIVQAGTEDPTEEVDLDADDDDKPPWFN